MNNLIATIPWLLLAAPSLAGQFRSLPALPASLPSVRVTVPVTMPKIVPVLPVSLPSVSMALRPERQMPSPDTRLPFVPTAIVRIINAPTAMSLAIAFDNAQKPQGPAPVAAPAPADLVKSNGGFTLPEQDLLRDIGVGQ